MRRRFCLRLFYGHKDHQAALHKVTIALYLALKGLKTLAWGIALRIYELVSRIYD
jgi:hypothetical protein